MRWYALAGLALALSGCGAEVLTATAIQADLQAQNARNATAVLQRVQDSQGLQNAQRAVDLYRGETGAAPASLEALVPKYLDKVPTQPDGTPLYYDARRGRVSMSPPDPNTINRETIAEVKQAITRYGTAVGYYPPTLDALVPQYLPVAPRTADGQPFIYNNQNGEVQVPSPLPGAISVGTPGTPMPVSGGGPLGETVGAIGVQQQLGNMGNSGVNSAGTRARSGLDAIGGAHDQQQQQTMDELGL